MSLNSTSKQNLYLEENAQHTLGHLDCPACEDARNQAMRSGHFGDYLFPIAAEKWLSVKRNSISSGNYANYVEYVKRLTTFFRLLPLNQIHIGHVHAYQKSRQRTAGASTINHELMTLGQIMALAGLWTEIKRFYKALSLPETCGIALSPDEAEDLMRLAHAKIKNDKRWEVCYWATRLGHATAAGPGEIRHLRVKDVDLERNQIEVRVALKTKHRARIIPLNDDAREAAEHLLERYQGMCEKFAIPSKPEHFILYHRAHERGAVPDASRCMGVWRSAWESLRKELAKIHPHLKAVRRYDLRHTAVTEMVEDGVPDGVIKQIIGHSGNSTIISRYTHAHRAAKEQAMNALQSHRTPPPEPENERVIPIRKLEVVNGGQADVQHWAWE